MWCVLGSNKHTGMQCNEHGSCYTLFRGSPDLKFGFRFGVPESGVGLDGASASGPLRRLDFHVRYLAIGGGHATGHDGKASDQMKGVDDEQRSYTEDFRQQ